MLPLQKLSSTTRPPKQFKFYLGGEAGDDDPGGRCGGEEEAGWGEGEDWGGRGRLWTAGAGGGDEGRSSSSSPESRLFPELCRPAGSAAMSELFNSTQPVRWNLCKISVFGDFEDFEFNLKFKVAATIHLQPQMLCLPPGGKDKVITFDI